MNIRDMLSGPRWAAAIAAGRTPAGADPDADAPGRV